MALKLQLVIGSQILQIILILFWKCGLENKTPSPDCSGNPTASPSTGSGQAGLRGIATESRFPAPKNEKAQTNLSLCLFLFGLYFFDLFFD
ncbi:hypothetical protein D3C87_398310 [compost metagenome]